MTKKDESLSSKIAYINRLYKRKVDSDTLKYGLTCEQGRFIVYLADQTTDVHLTDLANVFHVRKSSLNSLINNLEKKGCVKRESCEKDSRIKLIRLTDLGYEKAKLIQSSFEMNELKTKEVLTDIEISNLNEILDKIISKINKD